MPHTQSRYQQDLGFTDAFNPLCALDFIPSGAGAPTGFPTRNAVADFSWNVGASVGPITFSAALFDGMDIRTGFGEDLMEQFGGTGIPASAQPQFYRPDVIGAMAAGQQLIPRTALKVKGIKPLSLKYSYLISTVALTTHQIRVDKIVRANNVANTVTPIIANGANGLATAAQANPYTTVVVFPANQQVYSVTDLTEFYVEITVTTAATGAYRLNGVEFTYEFNFN